MQVANRIPVTSRALAAFLVLAGLFFWQLWAPNPADRMTIGAPPPGDGPGQPSDFLRQFYPYRDFVAGAWGSGHLPLWNPHQYAGTPALADPQQGVLYPWRLLQIPLAIGGRRLPLWAVQLEAVIHVALAGWFAYLLVRRLGAADLAAFAAGLTYAFGGYITGYPVDQLAVLDTAVWVPAALWALTAALDAVPGGWRPTLRWALVAGGATALSALAGHPQTAMYGVGAGLAWLAWRSYTSHLSPRAGLGVAAMWLLTAVGLAAGQWLPSLALLRHAGQRFSPAELYAGFPAGDAIQMLAPGVISDWSPLYVGAVALGLVVWGLGTARQSRFWIGLAIVAWLIALGGNGPVFGFLVRLAPAVGLFRHQERLAVLVSLGLAVATGLALASILRRPPPGARRALLVAAVLAVVTGLGATVGMVRPAALLSIATRIGVALPSEQGATALADSLAFTALVAGALAALLALRAAGRLGPRGLGLSLVGLMLLDLFSVNAGRVLVPHQPLFELDPIARALLAVARDGRVSSEGRLPGGANAASVFGFYDVTGDSPLQLAWVRDLVEELPEITWWRLLGVRYVVTDRDFEPGAPVTEQVRSGATALYRVELPGPQAWVAGRVEPEPASPPWRPAADFDPLTTVVLPPDVVAAVPADGVSGVSGATGEARLTGLTPNHATVETTLAQPGFLVLSTAYDPGWRVRARAADGRALSPPVVRAYTALPAVALPAGQWTVEWTYRPNTGIVGLVISSLTLVLGAALWRLSAERIS